MAANVSTKPVAENRPKPAQRPSRPNYNLIHKNPLPLNIDALPPLIPHNPLSLVAIAWVYVRSLVRPAKQPVYQGFFSPETRSIHVIDPVAIRALWESGFFGKGTLSRSEPTWLSRERKRRGLIAGDTSEDVTRRRRQQRAAFKKERARKEREEIEATLKRERQRAQNGDEQAAETIQTNGHALEDIPIMANQSEAVATFADAEKRLSESVAGSVRTPDATLDGPDEEVVEVDDIEHLQLTLEEAFFLVFGLGVLDIVVPNQNDVSLTQVVPREEIFQLFQSHAAFSPIQGLGTPSATTTFLANYAVYHHFRSLGWVVRPGTKFAVDWMIYHRGPVFSHAEFAVVTMPSPVPTSGKTDGKDQKQNSKPWHWLHMVNRVQSQVRKTLVLAFVEMPADVSNPSGVVYDPIAFLSRMRVREIVLKRWIPNRNRD